MSKDENNKKKKMLKWGRVEKKKPKKSRNVGQNGTKNSFGLKFAFVYSALKWVFKFRFKRIEREILEI